MVLDMAYKVNHIIENLSNYGSVKGNGFKILPFVYYNIFVDSYNYYIVRRNDDVNLELYNVCYTSAYYVAILTGEKHVL